MHRPENENVLSVKNLSVRLSTGDSYLTIINDASFDLRKSSTLGLIGESGSGKSMLCKSIVNLLPKGSRLDGNVTFYPDSGKPEELLSMSEVELRSIRGKKIGFLSQEPGSSMNPVMKCGKQVFDALPNFERANKKNGIQQVLKLLENSGLKNPEAIANSYPHELSGGMLQRVALAAALAGEPEILIADEPVTALDVSSRTGPMKSLSRLTEEMGLSVILVSHDIDFVSNWADDIMVMYLGSIVELGETNKILSSPAHPYTKALLDLSKSFMSGSLPETIPGDIPSMEEKISGCKFHPRCEFADELCSTMEPDSENAEHGGWKRCFHPIGVTEN